MNVSEYIETYTFFKTARRLMKQFSSMEDFTSPQAFEATYMACFFAR
jgi:hypothetical protein